MHVCFTKSRISHCFSPSSPFLFPSPLRHPTVMPPSPYPCFHNSPHQPCLLHSPTLSLRVPEGHEVIDLITFKLFCLDHDCIIMNACRKEIHAEFNCCTHLYTVLNANVPRSARSAIDPDDPSTARSSVTPVRYIFRSKPRACAEEVHD
jgi:hypothetical protein